MAFSALSFLFSTLPSASSLSCSPLSSSHKVSQESFRPPSADWPPCQFLSLIHISEPTRLALI
eukprot:7227098-Alexandrium_andersonii.AAC.1